VLGGDLPFIFSDLHEALAVCLVGIDCCWPVAGASDGSSTVICVAARWPVIPLENEVSEGKTSKGEENECWSHDERLFERENFGVDNQDEFLVMIKVKVA
jgi:hypothetical protein